MKRNEEEIMSNTESLSSINELEKTIEAFSDQIDGLVYPLIIPPVQSIDEDILFEIYPHLRKIGKRDKLHILLYSYGGDAHTAYHIGRLLQDYATKELHVYVLRQAKSAATLLACAADVIVFSEISELGPMDPQFKSKNQDQRFSPLAIKHTFDLLHQETKANHDKIVQSLTSRLPEPLVLGELLKSLETGKEYLVKLMSARMFKKEDEKKIKEIAEKLVTGYPDHGYCIDYLEGKNLGLKVRKISEDLADLIFDINRNYKDVWDEFFIKYQKGRKNPEDDKAAFAIYVQLKKLAENIIDYQIKKEQSPQLNLKEKNGSTSKVSKVTT